MGRPALFPGEFCMGAACVHMLTNQAKGCNFCKLTLSRHLRRWLRGPRTNTSFKTNKMYLQKTLRMSALCKEATLKATNFLQQLQSEQLYLHLLLCSQPSAAPKHLLLCQLLIISIVHLISYSSRLPLL